MQKLLLAVVAIAVIGGGYWWFSNQQAPTTETPATSAGTNEQTTETLTPPPVETPSAPMSATVTYNGDSFSPQEVTIKKGGTVRWINTSGGEMWVASAQHPSHLVYSGTARQEHCPDASGTAFDQCTGGSDYSFTFTKVGTWGYHDHLNASLFGKVIVVE